MNDDRSGLVFKSSTNARGPMDLFYSSVLFICICVVACCPCWLASEALLYAVGIGDFPPSFGNVVSWFCGAAIIFIIATLFNVTVGPSFTKVTLTFDGRLIEMRYPGSLFSRNETIYLGDVISIVRHKPRDNLSLRRIFGRFNPAKPGVLVTTAQKTYSINTEEFDKFAEVIKKYKPEVEISR